jgi:hypothetical protein
MAVKFSANMASGTPSHWLGRVRFTYAYQVHLRVSGSRVRRAARVARVVELRMQAQGKRRAGGQLTKDSDDEENEVADPGSWKPVDAKRRKVLRRGGGPAEPAAVPESASSAARMHHDPIQQMGRGSEHGGGEMALDGEAAMETRFAAIMQETAEMVSEEHVALQARLAGMHETAALRGEAMRMGGETEALAAAGRQHRQQRAGSCGADSGRHTAARRPRRPGEVEEVD